MNMLLQYARVLWGEQVWAGEQGPPRPECMYSYMAREEANEVAML